MQKNVHFKTPKIIKIFLGKVNTSPHTSRRKCLYSQLQAHKTYYAPVDDANNHASCMSYFHYACSTVNH